MPLLVVLPLVTCPELLVTSPPFVTGPVVVRLLIVLLPPKLELPTVLSGPLMLVVERGLPILVGLEPVVLRSITPVWLKLPTFVVFPLVVILPLKTVLPLNVERPV